MINTGDIVVSITGHDRGEHYLVIDCDKDFIYVADGRLKTLDKPKKKNKNMSAGLEKVKNLLILRTVVITLTMLS